MKKIVLLGAAPVAGTMRYPSEGEIEVSPDVAAELITVGLAKDAALSKLTVDELRAVAADELVDVPVDAKKPDLIEAIAAARGVD